MLWIDRSLRSREILYLTQKKNEIFFAFQKNQTERKGKEELLRKKKLALNQKCLLRGVERGLSSIDVPLKAQSNNDFKFLLLAPNQKRQWIHNNG